MMREWKASVTISGGGWYLAIARKTDSLQRNRDIKNARVIFRTRKSRKRASERVFRAISLAPNSSRSRSAQLVLIDYHRSVGVRASRRSCSRETSVSTTWNWVRSRGCVIERTRERRLFQPAPFWIISGKLFSGSLRMRSREHARTKRSGPFSVSHGKSRQDEGRRAAPTAWTELGESNLKALSLFSSLLQRTNNLFQRSGRITATAVFSIVVYIFLVSWFSRFLIRLKKRVTMLIEVYGLKRKRAFTADLEKQLIVKI